MISLGTFSVIKKHIHCSAKRLIAIVCSMLWEFNSGALIFYAYKMIFFRRSLKIKAPINALVLGIMVLYIESFQIRIIKPLQNSLLLETKLDHNDNFKILWLISFGPFCHLWRFYCRFWHFDVSSFSRN